MKKENEMLIMERVLQTAPDHIAFGEVRSAEEAKIIIDVMRNAPSGKVVSHCS